MVKILKYDNLYHKIKLKIPQIQVLGKSTGQINNTDILFYDKSDTFSFHVMNFPFVSSNIPSLPA